MTSTRAYVWDLPTRLFHWALVALIAFSWWSARSHHMDWHRLSGTVACGLLIFRLCWGCIGTTTARFSHFVRGPREVMAYLRGSSQVSAQSIPGHNPLGGLSVVLMLATLLAQVGSGLLSVDVDGIESGPLSQYVSFDQGRLAAHVHGLSFNILLGLIGLHVTAILFWLVAKRRNLVTAMITGWQTGGTGDVAIRTGSLLRLIASVLVAASVAWWIGQGAPI